MYVLYLTTLTIVDSDVINGVFIKPLWLFAAIILAFRQ